MSAAPLRFRRCAHLSVEPVETLSLDLSDFLSGALELRPTIHWRAVAPHLAEPVVIDEQALGVIGRVGPTRWMTFDDLGPQLHASAAKLLDAGILVAEGGAFARADSTVRETYWFGPAAVAHAASRWSGVDARTDPWAYAEVADMVRDLGPPPPRTIAIEASRYETFAATAEPTPLEAVLARRITGRNYSAAPAPDRATIGTLLHRVFGFRATLELAPGATVGHRSSPSGGGLHPIEAFVLVQRAIGLDAGLYHYEPDQRRLALLPYSVESLAAFAASMVAGQRWFADAPVLVALVARFARNFWKYRNHAKAHRVLVLDTGHLSQTLQLAATELGLESFVTAAINERDIAEGFGYDPLQMDALAVCGFGHRNADGTTLSFAIPGA